MEPADKRGKIGVEDKGNENPNLPQEIIVEILSRLPVKSLCKFRVVSKPWLSLITDPHFVDVHLNKTLNNDDLHSRRQRLLVTGCSKMCSVNYESIHGYNDDIVARELDYPNWEEDDSPLLVDVDFLIPFYGVRLLGSCHGLVCIELDGKCYYLFNPATREYKKIPEKPGDDECVNLGRGFGYDRENDDFKLVDVCSCHSLVYSLRSGKWRRVEDFGGNFQHQTGIFLYDAIHWAVSYGSSELRVAGFNLINETFWEWDMPAGVTTHGTEFYVGAIKGCICLFQCYTDMQNHFWMMTKYNKQDSWTKITISFSYMYMSPVCLSVIGEYLFLVDEERLVLYNSEDDKHVALDLNRSFIWHSIYEALSYIESLISPHAFCKNLQDGVQCDSCNQVR